MYIQYMYNYKRKRISRLRYLKYLKHRIDIKKRNLVSQGKSKIFIKYSQQFKCPTSKDRLRLFARLAKRKCLKIIGQQLPTFNFPQKLRAIVSNGSLKRNGVVLIPYEQVSEGIQFLEIQSKQLFSYNGNLDISVAQMRLEQKTVIIPQYVKKFFTMRLNGINKSSIEAINLWYYKGQRISTWHYDGHDNFLFMLKGKKIVYLMPPKTGISQANLNTIIKTQSLFNTNNNHMSPNFYSQLKNWPIEKCQLNEGDCLFIPRGWWHCVFSYGDPNIAINIWGNSLIQNMLKSEKQVFLRHLILQISQKMCSSIENWDSFDQNIKQKYRMAKFMIYLRSIS